MAVLLDSHVLVWLLFNPTRLGPQCREILEKDTFVMASKVSLWELAIKRNVGKFPYEIEPMLSGLERSGLIDLDIENRHIAALDKVRLPHRDPWDAMLVAQSIADSLHLLTADSKILGAFEGAVDATR